jgi:exopolyphosphatase/guanosine-5'-triphosphate,3'-diphosphate pyrophosphatase
MRPARSRAEVDDSPVAAVDVGTNTTLMLIAARGSDGGLRVLADHCSTTRLGEGIATSGVLAEAAMERTLDCLRGFSDQARSAGVSPERQRLVSTAVLRRAADAQRFQDRVRSELGLTLEVLSESEEGRLAHRAVAQTLGRRRKAAPTQRGRRSTRRPPWY